jgi:hypothetical protein
MHGGKNASAADEVSILETGVDSSIFISHVAAPGRWNIWAGLSTRGIPALSLICARPSDTRSISPPLPIDAPEHCADYKGGEVWHKLATPLPEALD